MRQYLCRFRPCDAIVSEQTLGSTDGLRPTADPEAELDVADSPTVRCWKVRAQRGDGTIAIPSTRSADCYGTANPVYYLMGSPCSQSCWRQNLRGETRRKVEGGLGGSAYRTRACRGA